MRKIAVFASGSGTNFEAIQNAINDKLIDAKIELLVCDKKGAKVIEKAQRLNVETFVFDPKAYSSKQAFETEIVNTLQAKGVEFIFLAGYMRLISDTLLQAYDNRIINIHPSLLPAFKGKDAIGQAIAYGVRVMGVTIHYVNSEMDGGKIIDQKAFYVEDGMSSNDIENKIHQIEHKLYPETIRKILEEVK